MSIEGAASGAAAGSTFGPAGAVAGALIGGAASIFGGNEANAASAREAAKNRTFQREMSWTAHQRGVEDLRKAGLNPILSAKGAAAPMAGGAQGQMQNAVAPGVASALDSLRLKKEIKAVDSQTALNKINEEVGKQTAMKTAYSAENVRKQNEALDETLKVLRKQTKWDLKSMDYRNMQDLIQRGLNTGNSARDLINPFNFGKKPNSYNPKKEGVFRKKDGLILD